MPNLTKSRHSLEDALMYGPVSFQYLTSLIDDYTSAVRKDVAHEVAAAIVDSPNPMQSLAEIIEKIALS